MMEKQVMKSRSTIWINYAKSHNLSVKSYYDHVAAQLDLDNLIDFYIANQYFCNLDWPTNNIKVWRNKNSADPSGFDTKCRFVLLDMDMAAASPVRRRKI